MDIVYHLGARTAVNSSLESPHATYETNVLGTFKHAGVCCLCDIDKIVYASSYVYGTPQYLPIDEKTQANNPYSKQAARGRAMQILSRGFWNQVCYLQAIQYLRARAESRFSIPKIISSFPRERSW
ncbi:MAG: GDP-mannose 4,6-dehydratase [Methanothrix sp.]|nr:GDP-mannose 4,6-dehydratase [Methanothrix sp.]